jgi:MraZ protein
MFLGRYDHNIDEKGRMTIPARFRDLLDDGAYITQGFDQNLIVLTTSSFQKIYQHINQMSMTDPVARQLKRLMFAHADRVEVDRVGRILIPQFLRTAACIENAAVVVGVGDYFEIWSPLLWTKEDEKLLDADANAQRFAALDLPSL